MPNLLCFFFLDKTGVDEIGVDEQGVDKIVDKTGTPPLGSELA